MKTGQIRLRALPRLVLTVFVLASIALVLESAKPIPFTRTTITSSCDPQIPAPIVTKNINCGATDVFATRNWSQDISWFDSGFGMFYLADRSNLSVDIIDTATGLLAFPSQAEGLCGPALNTTAGAKLNCADAGPNGIVVDNGSGVGNAELWVGDGDSQLKGYPLDAFGLPITQEPPSHIIWTGGNKSHEASIDLTPADRADELALDPTRGLILVANDKGSPAGFVSFVDVDPLSGTYLTVVGQIVYDGDGGACPLVGPCSNADLAFNGIEQPQYVPSVDKFFLAVPQTDVNPGGQIDVIDPVTMTVTTSYGFKGANWCIPHGLTVGPVNAAGHTELLVGCNGGSAVPGTNSGTAPVADPVNDTPSGTKLISLVIDDTGKIIARIPQVGGSDEVWYNPSDKRYYTASSSQTITGLATNPPSRPRPVMGVIDAVTHKWIMNIDTGSGAHSVAAVGFRKAYVAIRVDSRVIDATPESGGIAVFKTKK